MSRKPSLTFSDALKHTRSAAFSTMVKPIGSACNLDCHYCYYIGKADLYNHHQPKMSYELLEEYIRQYIEMNTAPVVTFVWHGGEPLLAGIDYYRKALEFQKKYAGEKRIENSLQTNGLLVNEDWCSFFKDNNFLIGISIDGPEDIHDAYRRTRGNQPSFAKVINAIELMSRQKVEYNTLSVVNNLSEGRGVETYRFLKSIGSHFMQFLPAVEHAIISENGREIIVPPNTEGAKITSWSVSPKGFGQFLCSIFDEWVISDVGEYFVQLFDAALAQWVGVPPGLCSLSETCGDALVVEHNGDVYSCDHFVYSQYKLGNIMEVDLLTMLKSKGQFKFGLDKRNNLPKECLRCRYYFACRGECPKHRFDVSKNGEKNMNALCEAYKIFFNHVEPYMKYMAELLSQRRSPTLVIPWARQKLGLL